MRYHRKDISRPTTSQTNSRRWNIEWRKLLDVNEQRKLSVNGPLDGRQ
jgi:hypothetical protein